MIPNFSHCTAKFYQMVRWRVQPVATFSNMACWWENGFPRGTVFWGDEIVQLVLLSSLRLTVLQTAHDGVAGHLGVRKTYDLWVMRHFYWPRLKSDILAFIKTCHTYKLTGKPNQAIKPAPLHPIPVAETPFEHLLLIMLVLCHVPKLVVTFCLQSCVTLHVILLPIPLGTSRPGCCESTDTVHVYFWNPKGCPVWRGV